MGLDVSTTGQTALEVHIRQCQNVLKEVVGSTEKATRS